MTSERRGENGLSGRRVYKMEPTVGIEPTTCSLRNCCSTTELRWLLNLNWGQRRQNCGVSANVLPTSNEGPVFDDLAGLKIRCRQHVPVSVNCRLYALMPQTCLHDVDRHSRF